MAFVIIWVNFTFRSQWLAQWVHRSSMRDRFCLFVLFCFSVVLQQESRFRQNPGLTRQMSYH